MIPCASDTREVTRWLAASSDEARTPLSSEVEVANSDLT